MAQWIWKFGEFEFYHNQQVHRKRQAYGYNEPAIWKVYRPEAVVEFTKEIDTDGGMIHVEACGAFAVSLMDVPNDRNPQWFGRSDIQIPAGKHILDVRVMNFDTFPALYIEGIVETDETWKVDDMTLQAQPAVSDEWFCSKERVPDVFPFSYQPVKPVSKEKIRNGVLYDFGRETFAKTYLSGLKPGESFRIQFGESKEEALDSDWSVIHFDAKTDPAGSFEFEAYAFRYIYVDCENAEISAEYEYIPMKTRGEFLSDSQLLNKIWETSAYTFHLNCREMLLDGIKRDRWVWAADVYQSLFVNKYLFFDKKIEQRTLIALGGKRPFERHINTIMDYTFFWFMLETGATTLYEEYDPSQEGTDHYAMYGRPYEKSLCHAWSASPIYFMGAFRLGVVSTDVAYRTYEVRPDLGTLKSIEGKVPVPGGYIYVKADRKRVEVLSDIPGGRLIIGEQKYPIIEKKKMIVEY